MWTRQVSAQGSFCQALSRKEIEIIRPLLHHLASLFQILGVLIGGAYLVLLDVGELGLDHVRPVAELVESRATVPRKPWGQIWSFS